MREFEFEGLWWLPETPEPKVPGTLRFFPDSGASLDLLGSLWDPGNQFAASERSLTNVDLILGLSSKGKPVTLWNCGETRKMVNLVGFTKTSFHAEVVVVGAHLGGIEEAQFKKMSTEYRHLDEWAGISGFEIQRPIDHATHPMIIEHKIPAPVAASIAGTRVAIEVRATLKETSGLVGEVTIAQRTWASAESSECGSFGELNRMLHRLRNFLTLGVGRLVEPLAVRGVVESDGGTPVEIHYRPAGRGTSLDKNVRRTEMLFVLDDLGEDFERFLGNWFGKAEPLGPVYDLYFATAYSSSAYLDDRFLSLVQAVEAYHRRALGTTELPEDEHERRLEETISAVPNVHKDWLRGKLTYSNEPSLRKRLKEIMRRDPEVMKPIFGKSKKERGAFVGKVVDTRNYLTHYDESKKDEAAVGRKLYELTEKLKSVLEACLLREVGFEGDSLKEILLRTRRFA